VISYNMNILLRHFNTKIGREDIFEPTVENESLHELVMIMTLE